MADKLAVVICSLLATWRCHDSFTISPAFARPVPYKIVQHLLARWRCHYLFNTSPAFTRPVPYKIVWYMLARWSTPLFLSIRPLHTNWFDVLCLSGNKQRGVPLNMNGKNDEETCIENYRRLQNTHAITLLTTKI